MSETARTWGLRLLALGIAIGIWFNASLQDRLVSSERLVEARLSYNRPRGFVILHPVPIALHPVGRAVLSDPFGDHHSEDIERRAQRFPDTL